MNSAKAIGWCWVCCALMGCMDESRQEEHNPPGAAEGKHGEHGELPGAPGTPPHMPPPPQDKMPPGGTEVLPDESTSPSPLRRLSVRELDLTVSDLFGFELRPSAQIGDGAGGEGYENDLLGLTITSPGLSSLMKASEFVAKEVLLEERRDTTLGCELGEGEAEDSRACVESFVHTFLPRAYRRAVSAQEIEQVVGVWEKALELGLGPEVGVQLALEKILTAPAFLYRVEVGSEQASPSDSNRRMLTSYEMASRLSYLLWGTMPGPALLEAAARDEVRTADQVEAWAKRLLRQPDGTPHPKAQANIEHFHTQWLGLRKLHTRAVTSLPQDQWEEQVRPALLEEIRLFLNDVFWQGGLSDLTGGDYTYLNDTLAAHYGLESGGDGGASFKRVTLPPGQRQGLFTQGAILALTGDSAIHRGAYVIRHLICQPLQDPPADAVDELPEPTPGESERARLAPLTQSGGCKGCHVPMHGIGFGFSHYDETGKWRAVSAQGGQPVDASGEVMALGGTKYNGVLELSDLLGESNLVEQCMLKNFFHFGYGRIPGPKDQDHLRLLEQASVMSGGKFEHIILMLVRSEEFRSRSAPSL